MRNKENDEYIVYGIRPMIEAIKSDKKIEKILLQNGLQGELIQELNTLIQAKHINTQYVPAEKLNKLCWGNHQGVLGFISRIDYFLLENIFSDILDKKQVPLLLICDRITDVRNFGAMVRTAECAGVHAIIIPSHNSAAVNEDAIKTSAGALHIVPICREENIKTTIHFLKANGVQILAITEKGRIAYTQANFHKPTALILGSEEDGVSSEYLKLCDQQLYIPLLGKIDSLNVSVANGVILYEAVRQRASTIQSK
ncbi:MAG: 23S rRNA (guanosine(2251)-2'-O)-methyltransferase RlmB [Bacteroidales bacterium]